jgi:hypothetical protein
MPCHTGITGISDCDSTIRITDMNPKFITSDPNDHPTFRNFSQADALQI